MVRSENPQHLRDQGVADDVAVGEADHGDVADGFQLGGDRAATEGMMKVRIEWCKP